MIIALPSDTGLLGVLDLSAADPDAFAEVDSHLLERVGTQLSLAIKNAQLYDEIKRMHLGNLKALSSALNAKDYYTLGHAARVAAYTVMLGRQLGWEEDTLSPIEEAAYLHDIGKISISDRVLLKPSRLNQQEWDQMREHPVVSADIIRPLFPPELVLGVRHHHEHYDGTGYPDGLAGEEIPTLARAMAVVDAYDAMSCRRPYKAALTYTECLTELRECSGTQFDPDMVGAFLQRARGHRTGGAPRRRRWPRRPPPASAVRPTGRWSRSTTRAATRTARSRPCCARSATPIHPPGSSPPTPRWRSGTSSASTRRRRRPRSHASATRSSPTTNCSRRWPGGSRT